ncbi:hypothetical protein OHA72_07730 [Dactylosporangium sp. NBC_01737]|uniref:hypothetical protein n=1 Tax=Dactylosporangium sp. NBC_01737 TaxID=2975959 RepID=UPI002E142651|nr:hypothetical protein OHA72_07730 [Dactylosporangium sp. NBC_01737]
MVDSEHDRRSLQRRLEVLRLPVVPLTLHGELRPRHPQDWKYQPEAVGVGPDGTAFAVWPHRDDAHRKRVTSHAGTSITATIDITTDLTTSFVQPLPDGHVLLVAARTRPGAPPNAQVWTGDGRLARTGHLGDAIEEVLTTPSGSVWVGYFDEALGGSGPQGHGLARFTQDLTPDWLYPFDAGLPVICDCYTLNVVSERAYCCAYTDFHLVSVEGNQATDWGAAPYRSAHSLLVQDEAGALISGPGPEYDLVTPFRRSGDDLEAAGQQRRLVLPDGLEARRLRSTCRGPDLHVFRNRLWYRTTLDDLFASP